MRAARAAGEVLPRGEAGDAAALMAWRKGWSQLDVPLAPWKKKMALYVALCLRVQPGGKGALRRTAAAVAATTGVKWAGGDVSGDLLVSVRALLERLPVPANGSAALAPGGGV